MCGIAAILTPNSSRRTEFLERAIDLLQHRGPDGQGQWQDESAGIAHRRLAILELSEAGAQPMRSESGRYIISYNGEIYNHLELRAKYFNGRSWRGHSDTETLLALFEMLGDGMFAVLVGMWAMTIWDTQGKKLLISRDRYGQKPLYYRFYPDGSFALASEIKPLLFPGQKNPINPLMAAEYLALGNYGHLGEQTFFAEVQQLLPACFAWVRLNDRVLKTKAYWHLPSVSHREKLPVGPLEIEQLREGIIEAVRSQTLSDVAIGATLSGGLDSSLVTGILASGRDGADPIDIFTAQTPGSRWDESSYVRAVQDKWGTRMRLHTRDLNQMSISEHLERAIWIQEEPFGDPSIIAHGFLMDMARYAGIKVILGGQGADEVFRGYPHNIQQLFAHELSHLNWRYALPEMQQAGLKHLEYARILLGAFLPRVERQMRLKSRKKRRFFLSSTLQDAALVVENQSILPMANDWDGSLRESVQGVHIPHLVHYDDRNGMARSIEGRMPFLDHRLLELTASWQPTSFYRHGLSKVLLRQAGREFLPDVVAERRDKLGFFTPIHEMLHNEVEWVADWIDSMNIIDNVVFNDDIVFYREKKKDNERSRRLWRSVSFNIWAKQFNTTL